MSRPVADVIEDLEFLNDSLVGATDAARRTDFPSAHAMEKWLERHGPHRPLAGLQAPRPRRRTPQDSSASSSSAVALRRWRATEERREAEQRAREEVAELEKALASARAALRQAKGQGKVAPIAVGSGVSAAELRAWAARNGVACPATGRVPAKVREAFESAQQVAS